jgi:hypothetical protein
MACRYNIRHNPVETIYPIRGLYSSSCMDHCLTSDVSKNTVNKNGYHEEGQMREGTIRPIIICSRLRVIFSSHILAAKFVR